MEFAVGMGEAKIAYDEEVLYSPGLGSCIGVAIYDEIKKIAGLAHIMLPNSKTDPDQIKLLLAEHSTQTKNKIKELINEKASIIAETTEVNSTIKAFKEKNPNITLLSAFLPPTNCHDAIKELLSINKTASILILSPQTEPSTIRNYIESGARDVIMAPYNGEVMNIIETESNRRLLKYADKAVPALIAKLKNRGATDLKAKIAGGAHMFPSLTDDIIKSIGLNNTNGVKKALNEANIPLLAEEVGGNVGRTIRFKSNGELEIKTKEGTKIL